MDYPGKVITKTQVTPTQTSASGNWTLDDQAAAIKNNNWPVALVPNPISKSLRFNSADSAYLNRTVGAAATSNTLTTFNFWFKRAKLGTSQQLFASATSAPNVACYIELTTSDTLKIYLDMTAGGSDETTWTTSAVFRDVSAWYGATIKVDTSQASNANKVVLYINGVSQTLTASQTGTAVSTQRILENGISLTIGKYFNSSGYGDFYLTEFNCIDGQALTPSSFGMTNPQTGQWIPIKYSGTYGTNGFYLNFKDATSTTTLGYDYSGNANNWTTNNFSVTAGSGNDSLTDVPTPWVAYNTTGDVGGVVRGNYATFNPINLQGSNTSGTITDGNLKSNPSASAGYTNYLSSIAVPATGYWYAEFTVSGTYQGANNNYVGIQLASSKSTTFIGNEATTYGYADGNITTGSFRNNGTISQSVAGFQTGDTLMVAIGNGGVWFGKNGTWLGTGSPNPATSTSPAYSGLSGDYYFAYSAYGTAGVTYGYSSYANFGQRPFAYTPPAGFRSLCTTNLPATTIGFGLTNQADDYFNAVTYAGAGAGTVITTGFYPDFAWMKNRTAAFSNFVQDSVRGGGVYLLTDTTDADASISPSSTFSSTGITINANSSYASNSSYNYVAWAWKANAGSTVSNTAGSITSTVSANTTSGFSIVTYTGNGTNGATVGHGLGVAPKMIFVKRRTTAGASWLVYHASMAATPQNNFLVLNATDAVAASALPWNNTAPTSTVITLGTSGGTNNNTDTFVAYCFAAVSGYSAFGSYTGNGSTDGPFVYTGFRPRYLLVKNASDGTANAAWIVIDSARSDYNQAILYLVPNTSGAEASSTGVATDFLSNGFKIRNTSTAMNANTNTIIYAAFAESPFQFANAR